MNERFKNARHVLSTFSSELQNQSQTTAKNFIAKKAFWGGKLFSLKYFCFLLLILFL